MITSNLSCYQEEVRSLLEIVLTIKKRYVKLFVRLILNKLLT